MAVLLFRLSGVPDDEAEDVRELLTAHDLAFYETTAGWWGTSVAAIWLRDVDRIDEAKYLLNTYQKGRAQWQQAVWQDQVNQGEAITLWRRFKTAPIQVTLILSLVAAIAFISIAPFIG